MPDADLAQIARSLTDLATQLTRRADSNPVVVAATSPPNMIRRATRLLAAVQARLDVFGDGCLAAREPGCNMLLYIHVAERRGRPVAVSELSSVSGLASTTALRWIDGLSKDGLIQRHPDKDDARRVHVRLTDRGRDMVTLYLRKWPD